MADSIIASNPSGITDLYGKGIWGPYYVNRQTAVVIYVNDNADLTSLHTFDGGLTWTTSVIGTGTYVSLACWFDQETPNDTGVFVHIVSLEDAGGTFDYDRLNAETGITENGATIQSGINPHSVVSGNRCCITKTRSGDLIAAYSTQSEIGCERTTDSTGATGWTVIDDVYETATEEDQCLLYPADTGDGNDAAALFMDRSSNSLTIKIYDEGTDTWGNEIQVDSVIDDDIYFHMDGSIRHSDGHLLVSNHSFGNTTSDDLRNYDVTLGSSPSSSDKTDIFTNQDASALCAVVIDQPNDDWYVAYAKGGTWESSVQIVYHVSHDGGDTWETEEAYSETADDYRALSGGRTIGQNGGFVQWIFFDDDDVEILNNLVNDVLIQAGSAPVGGIWRFNHGNQNPLLLEDGDDGFLGVSGEAQSATEADVQLKIYHQYLCKKLNMEFSTLTAGAPYTGDWRDDGISQSNLSVSPTGTGFIEDETGADLPAANSLVNFIVDGSVGMHGDDAAVRLAQVSYENASLLAPVFAGVDVFSFSETRYSLPSATFVTTEAERQHKIKRSTVYKNLRVRTTTLSGTWEVALTNNGVTSTNVELEFTATGVLEDITGSESFSDGDLFGIEWVETVGGNISSSVFQVEANTFEDWKVAPLDNVVTRSYSAFTYVDADTNTALIDNMNMRIGTVLAGNLQTYITIAGSGSRDITLREGGSDSSNVTIDVTGTGFFEDIAGVETIIDDDGVGFSYASSGAATTHAWIAVEIPHTVVVVVVGEDQPFIMGSLPEFGIGRHMIILVY